MQTQLIISSSIFVKQKLQKSVGKYQNLIIHENGKPKATILKRVKYEQYIVLRDELLSDDPDCQSSIPGLHTGPQLRQARIPARSGVSNPI